jgi:GntR family phosphonate transport system transcriptional regulator
VVRRQNREPAASIIQVREVVADDHMAEALAIRPGRPLLLVDRLSLADGKPIVYGSHHFPLARFPGLPQAVREHLTLTAALAACGVADYLRKVTRVTARLPTLEEAELLRMPRSRPILLAETINVDGEGRPIEFGIGRYATPRVQIVFEP